MEHGELREASQWSGQCPATQVIPSDGGKSGGASAVTAACCRLSIVGYARTEMEEKRDQRVQGEYENEPRWSAPTDRIQKLGNLEPELRGIRSAPVRSVG